MPDPVLSGNHYSVWKTRCGGLSVDCNDPMKALHEMAYDLHETKQKLANQITLVATLELDLDHAPHHS
jgi:hypothetical protein